MGQKKILIVDDSEAFRLKLRNILGSNYTLVEAVDGQSGYDKAYSSKDLSLIIADYIMPGGLNGLQMLGEIRKLPHHQHTPMVMLTTEINARLKQEAKKLGVTAWIVKPIEDKALLSVIEKCLTGIHPKP